MTLSHTATVHTMNTHKFFSWTSRTRSAGTPQIQKSNNSLNRDEIISNIQTMIHHPRSLTRHTPKWHPPTHALPGLTKHSLSIQVQRYRVGSVAAQSIRVLEPYRNPAYLVIASFENGRGHFGICHQWITDIVGEDCIDCVHLLPDDDQFMFAWVVDSQFQPMHSPQALFDSRSAA